MFLIAGYIILEKQHLGLVGSYMRGFTVTAWASCSDSKMMKLEFYELIASVILYDFANSGNIFRNQEVFAVVARTVSTLTQTLYLAT